MPKIYMTQYCLRKCLAITSDKHRLAMEECTVNNPRQVKKSSHVNILERIAQKFKNNVSISKLFQVISCPFNVVLQVWAMNFKKNDERNADK